MNFIDHRINNFKWKWAGYIACSTDNRRRRYIGNQAVDVVMWDGFPLDGPTNRPRLQASWLQMTRPLQRAAKHAAHWRCANHNEYFILSSRRPVPPRPGPGARAAPPSVLLAPSRRSRSPELDTERKISSQGETRHPRVDGMRAVRAWPAATAAVLLLALAASAMDDAEMEDITYNHEPQTEDPDRDVKETLYSYKIVTTTTTPVTNATKRPLQCFFCSYDSKMPRLRTCLDPVKFAVYRMMTRLCRSADDECFTSVMFNATHEAVHRGCSSDCVATTGTNCCKTDNCNNHSVFAPERFEKLAVRSNGSTKSVQTSIFFIVTIMLVLHTAVRAAANDNRDSRRVTRLLKRGRVEGGRRGRRPSAQSSDFRRPDVWTE
ncbi:hypothetical protein EVAR_24296_1 [Eumeta japonica]|uniref:Uncharacterized protein n=1 Tax=Eumeta variegata TaxID=151549 RepID=A0A4C1VGM8_EUMVA|nr:hypothetical protein EVAR_24296_1 [Eumeta japonica]